jgi:endonuclease/exonuclease/phosphatase family metal-dependent hydrolase
MTSRRCFLGSLATAPLLATLHSPPAVAGPPRSRPDELLVMTYNLRYANNQKPNAWPDRRPVMKALLDDYTPDLMGTQEGVYYQLKELADDQPAYAWIGTGRDGGSRGEFMAIFYRRDRFEPLEYDHFWLSDTPEVIASTSWGNTNRRMVTWARFKDRQTNREFYFWNTHLDHQIQLAREKGAALIRERITKMKPELPLFLVGDFNAYATENPAYDLLVKDGGLADTWFTAQERRNTEANSFNNFGPLERKGKRIDWVLSRGAMDVRATEIVTFKMGDQWPSDHFPVAAWLTLK